jgi:hypothetical protein
MEQKKSKITKFSKPISPHDHTKRGQIVLKKNNGQFRHQIHDSQRQALYSPNFSFFLTALPHSNLYFIEKTVKDILSQNLKKFNFKQKNNAYIFLSASIFHFYIYTFCHLLLYLSKKSTFLKARNTSLCI